MSGAERRPARNRSCSRPTTTRTSSSSSRSASSGRATRCLKARDGEEALQVAREARPDLAVLDVMMPKLDGFEVTRASGPTAQTKAMPIILLTARAQDADVQAGFDAGADDYLRKPFSPQELRARVQAILGRR